MTLLASHFSSPDVINLWAWRPTAQEAFCLVEFQVGDEGSGDLFSCVVATPEALAARRQDGQLVIRERATLIVDEFDWPKIQKFIEDLVQGCKSTDWPRAAVELQRWFIWEYEAMK